MALERAVDVRKAPLVVLVHHRRRHSFQIDLEHQVWSGIIPVVAVSHLDDEITAVCAVDESFSGKSLRLVVALLVLSQPDVFGHEMKRRRVRCSLARVIGHQTDFLAMPRLIHRPKRRQAGTPEIQEYKIGRASCRERVLS